jgi:DNA-directed RNA polymerase
MVTPALIEEQLQLEQQAKAWGLKRFRDNTVKLENQTYASATAYGASSIEAALPQVTEQINQTYLRIRRGHVGKDFAHIHTYLDTLEAEYGAAIALKVVFDHVFSPKEGANLLQKIASAIGAGIEHELELRWYATQNPQYLEYVKRTYWHKACGTANKSKLTNLLMDRKDVHWPRWGTTTRIKLGGWLLDCVMTSTGWFQRMTFNRKNLIIPTAEFLDIKDQLLEQAELFTPMTWPMVVPPNKWSNEQRGGYLTNDLVSMFPLVRRSAFDGLLKQGETPLQFINKLQEVAYTLNDATVQVAKVLLEQGIQVGKFLPIINLPLPNKPVDIATNDEARKSYRRQTAETMNKNAAAFRNSCRTRMTMSTVELFKGHDRFYLPWSFDYRGRTYPIPAFLTPMDTDFGKSLLKFADPAPMTPEAEYWLAFQVATTFGLDKASMEERQQWAQSPEARRIIQAVATDPLVNRCEWEAVEEPWQFMAACVEYYECVVAKTRSWTNLPVAIDATCSGLQILAGLAKDQRTATLVNVTPSECPQDAYKVVAEAAKLKLPKHLAQLLDRKVTKRTVMTIPYNATRHSNRQYIRDALKEKSAEFTPDDLTLIVNAVREAMEEIVPGPMRVMQWIKEEVGKAFKERNALRLQWTTPSGFSVAQARHRPNVQEIRLQILGRCRIAIADGYEDTPDINGHKSCTAPNLIHSLDASLLHIAFLKFDAPFTVIHDSVLCRATDMGKLNNVVRETYMELFTSSNVLEDFAQAIGAETPPPIIGDLDPSSVLNSTYFFC